MPNPTLLLIPSCCSSWHSHSWLCSWVTLLRFSSAFSASLRYPFLFLLFSFFLSSCSRTTHNPSALLFVIESNPANLDPRYSSDAQSQRIDRLLFDGLVERDAQMNLHPDLAES
jgi:hypothetical protein